MVIVLIGVLDAEVGVVFADETVSEARILACNASLCIVVLMIIRIILSIFEKIN